MSVCTKHGIKISWKGYPKCPACEHMNQETRELQGEVKQLKTESIKDAGSTFALVALARQDGQDEGAEAIKALQADLARSRRVSELAIKHFGLGCCPIDGVHTELEIVLAFCRIDKCTEDCPSWDPLACWQKYFQVKAKKELEYA